MLRNKRMCTGVVLVVSSLAMLAYAACARADLISTVHQDAPDALDVVWTYTWTEEVEISTPELNFWSVTLRVSGMNPTGPLLVEASLDQGPGQGGNVPIAGVVDVRAPLTGAVVFNQVVEALSGQGQVFYDVRELPAGVYQYYLVAFSMDDPGGGLPATIRLTATLVPEPASMALLLAALAFAGARRR